MPNGAKKPGLRPEAIAAGVVVTLGIAWLATRGRSKCKKLPGVWHEKGPLHMTKDAYEDAEEYIRWRIRDHIVSNAPLNAADIQIGAANHLEECDNWGDSEKMSDNQKQVWKAIGDLYGRIFAEAEANTELFLKTVQ